jgi:hypothetical protein
MAGRGWSQFRFVAVVAHQKSEQRSSAFVPQVQASMSLKRACGRNGFTESSVDRPLVAAPQIPHGAEPSNLAAPR